ncbi:MAG: hypothetical protein QM784_37600 [Polyangiaceae bacterium]
MKRVYDVEYRRGTKMVEDSSEEMSSDATSTCTCRAALEQLVYFLKKLAA